MTDDDARMVDDGCTNDPEADDAPTLLGTYKVRFAPNDNRLIGDAARALNVSRIEFIRKAAVNEAYRVVTE